MLVRAGRLQRLLDRGIPRQVASPQSLRLFRPATPACGMVREMASESGDLTQSLPGGGSPFAGLGEFAVASVEDRLLAASELVGGRDVAQGAVQPRVVVMLDELRDDATGLVQRQRRFLADAIVLDGAVIAFQLAVGLRVVRAGADVRHAAQPDELFEVARDELWACR